jgi:type I restriction enzyme S subunit
MRPTDAGPHPPDWLLATVGSAIEFKRGVSWSKDQESHEPRAGRVAVLRIGNVQDRLELDDVLYLSDVPTPLLQAKKATAGWSLIVGSNGNRQRVGKAALVHEDVDFLFASFLLAAKPKPSTDISPEYFYRWLTSERVQAYLSASAEGTTGLNNLSHSFLRAMAIPVPPPGEQRDIVATLDVVDAAVESANAAIRRARDLHRSVLHSLLHRGLDGTATPEQHHPGHWKVKRVDEVADVRSGLTLGADVTGVKTVELPYLRVANVQDGRVDLSTVKTVRIPVTDIERYRLEDGDVLMTEGGDIDKLGRGTIWRNEIKDCLHQNHIFAIRPNREHLVPEFYSLIVESDIAKRYFNRVAKRTTNLASTNKTQVRAFQFPLPVDIREQQAIVDVMATAKATLSDLVERHAALATLRRALALELLMGVTRFPSAEAVAVGA